MLNPLMGSLADLSLNEIEEKIVVVLLSYYNDIKNSMVSTPSA